MQFHISIILLVITTASASPETEVEFYHVTFPDWETTSLSELEGMLDCLVHGETCNTMREPYRAAYPSVLYAACELCTTEQKKAGYAFFKRAAKELPGRMDEFKNKFDPEGKYYEPFYNVLKASAQKA